MRFGQEQLLGDLTVRRTAGHQAQDIELALGERAGERTGRAAGRASCRTESRIGPRSAPSSQVPPAAFPRFFLRSFAYAGVGGVLVAVLAAVITLLFLLGHRVNAGRVLKAREDNGSSRRAAVAERATLVPALMQLAGRVNRWAPRWARSVHERMGPKES